MITLLRAMLLGASSTNIAMAVGGLTALLGSCSYGQFVYWDNPLGGDYSDGENWSTGSPPFPNESAAFWLDSNYTVALSEATWSPQLISIAAGSVTFDFGDEVLNKVGDSELWVGAFNGKRAELSIESGKLRTNYLRIGHEGEGRLSLRGPNSSLAIDDLDGRWNNIGENGLGWLTASNGASFSARATNNTGPFPTGPVIVSVGVGSGGLGNVLVTDPLSSIELQMARVGSDGGSGRLVVRNGGRFQAWFLALGHARGSNPPLTPSDGAVVIEGNGSVVEISNQTQVGAFAGKGSMTVRQGGSLISSGRASSPTGTSGIIAWLNESGRSQGSALVTGANSRWFNDGMLVVGWEGDGELTVSAGGEVISQRGQVGRVAGSTGMVTLTGNNSQWNIEQDLSVGGTEIGSAGTGTLLVSSGARLRACPIRPFNRVV